MDLGSNFKKYEKLHKMASRPVQRTCPESWGMPLSCTRSACQTVCPNHRRDLGLGYINTINPVIASLWQTFLKFMITGWQALHLTFGVCMSFPILEVND